MRDINWLITNYSEYLEKRVSEFKIRGEELQKSGSKDEAVLEKIKFNVVEIFSKMFKLSTGNTKEEIRDKYYAFFDKISSPWRLNRKKALEFGKEKDAIIEEIKLDEVEELRKQFEIYYNEL